MSTNIAVIYTHSADLRKVDDRVFLNFMKRIRHPRNTAIYFSLAVTMLIVVKLFVLGDFKYWKELPLTSGDTTVVVDERNLYRADVLEDLPQSEAPDAFISEANEEYLDEVRMARLTERLADFDVRTRVEEERVLARLKAEQVQKSARKPEPFVPHSGQPGRIVIMIDDVGLNRTQSLAALNLPAPITLAFLPYAPRLPEITGQAKAKGHELIIHVPMEPMSTSTDPGPMALKDGMNAEALKLNLSKIFKSFGGYVGINNHMGSKLTANPDAMRVVMEELAQRDLLFVDSKTSSKSVAANMAAARGLRYATRDVFLDHEDTPEFVAAALRKMERIAARKGVAIGIGHPKANTIAALKRWIPTLKDKNLVLVPVSSVVQREPLKIGAQSSDVMLQSPKTLPQIEPATY